MGQATPPAVRIVVHHYDDASHSDSARVQQTFLLTFNRLAAFWGTTPRLPVKVFVFRNVIAMKEQSGLLLPCARPGVSEAYVLHGTSYGHEMTHLFADAFNPQQRRWILVEGVASALDNRQSLLVRDIKAHAFAEQLISEEASSDSRSTACADARLAAGSFVSFLVRVLGIARFRTLYAAPDADAFVRWHYGHPLAVWLESWGRYIRELHGFVLAHPQTISLLNPHASDDVAHRPSLAVMQSLCKRQRATPQLCLALANRAARAGDYAAAKSWLRHPSNHRLWLIEAPWVYRAALSRLVAASRAGSGSRQVEMAARRLEMLCYNRTERLAAGAVSCATSLMSRS